MRSTIISSILLSLVALSGSQQAEAKATVEGGNLRILTARTAEGIEKRAHSPYNVGAAANAHAQHRRHHHKNNRRAACSATSSNSTSSSKKVSGAYGQSDEDDTSDTSSSSSSSSAATTSSSKSSSGKSASATSSASDSEETDVSPLAGSSDSSSSSSSSSTVASGSISGFSGTNTGIGSWFRTNAGSDSTNGMSWCETKYQDNWPCFAPSVGTMLSGYSDRQSAAKAYCGREAKVTNKKTGASATMFICDGFDDKWVRTPGSIDLTVGAFTTLNGGSFDNNKNNVLDVSWELTGNVVSQGTFQMNKYSK